MAINTIESCEKYNFGPDFNTTNSAISTGSNLTQCRLLKFNFTANGSVTSTTSQVKPGNKGMLPYLGHDGLQLFSHLTEKNLYKQQKEFVSSFPLAAKIYKASSDEFRFRKNRNKKNKKSVLTLPNERSVLPQSCTVSDMNDSEYFKRETENQNKAKKRLPKIKKNRNEFEFYDRDAKYLSQVNINLDCSSTDIIKNFKGDCRRKGRGRYNAKMADCDESQPHDVWAVLRNINQFQFNPSPAMSDDSIVIPRIKKKTFKKNKRKTASVIETCRTEQYYISSIDVSDKSGNSYSNSSLDRITVIDNEKELKEIFEEKPKEYKGPKNRSGMVKNKVDKCTKINPNNKKVTPRDPLKALNAPLVVKLEERNTKLKNEQKPWKTTKVEEDSLIISDVSVSRKSDANDDEVTNNQLTPYSNISMNCKKDSERFPRPKSPSVLEPKLVGPSKVLLSKGQELTLARKQQPNKKRNLRLVTTMPSSTPLPKLTQTEIRKRLTNIKFPIVVTGTDEVTGSMEVVPYYSQFNGLDDHIWPFMRAWYNKRGSEEEESEIKDRKCSAKKRNIFNDRSKRNEDSNKKPINYLLLNKQIVRPKKPITADLSSCIPKKKEMKLLPVSYDSQEVKPSVKSKPISQFRDKILKLLYKKASSSNIANGKTDAPGQTCVKKVEPKTEPKFRNATTNFNGGEVVEPHVSPIVDKDKPKITRTPSPKVTPTPPSKVLTPTPPSRVSTLTPPSRVSAPTPPCKVLTPTPPSKVLTPTPPSKILTPTPPPQILTPAKPQWGKTKWRSAFIDNVIRKLKTGAYYNNNDTVDMGARQQNDLKDIKIQTKLPNSGQGFVDMTPKITIRKKENSFDILPGFEDCLPQLEIKSMTRNQIAVKHCVRNVVFQFDVCVPVEQDHLATNFKGSTTCIPLSVSESKTKVFKCKTRIIHDILPAELCSIIPKVMNKLANADAILPTLQENDKNGNLSTISELTGAENLDIIKISLVPHIEMSPELIAMATGKFPKKLKQILAKSCFTIRKSVASLIGDSLQIVTNLLPSFLVLDKQFYLVPRPELLLPIKTDKLTPEVIQNPRIVISGPETINRCTDLVPYSPRRTNATSANQILDNLFYFMNGGLSNTIVKFDFKHPRSFINNTVTVDIMMKSIKDNRITMLIKMMNLEVESIQNSFANIFPVSNIRPSLETAKCIKYIKNVDHTKTIKAAGDSPLPSLGIAKRKKKRYVRLYKKCKSTSHISAEKSNTPLNKINNLDDFFQALGTGKLLSSAFEGYSGRKILASIIELKSWITEISPRQAMLVLLLNNKKDTPHLVRFRPVILQGIAVNRITRASEMDMEIEVIEREKFSALPEHERARNMFNTASNDSRLLEELTWIAKTTASDYQKPFNESSEKLLKDLLEKRKKLNPSYLRVMARYVGLGLLKPIKK